MDMKEIQTFITNPAFLVGVGLVILLLVLLLVFKGNSKKKLVVKISDYEVRYNTLKSIPLSFKLNKSVAIARLNEETMNQVTLCKDDYVLCQSNLKQLASLLADAEDAIATRKIKIAKEILLDLEATCELADNQISKLNEFLDTILEKETIQRVEISKAKENFREIKSNLIDKNAQLAYCYDMIENKISECEKLFSMFEEWMYASEFEKAHNISGEIYDKIAGLETINNEFPSLLQEARGFIPNLIDEVMHVYSLEKNRGVYLDHLEVKKNVDVIYTSLQENLAALKVGNFLNISTILADYKVRLNQLLNQIHRESISFDEVSLNKKKTDELIDDCKQLQEYIISSYEDSKDRYGLEDITSKMVAKTKKINDVSNLCEKITTMMIKKVVPSTTILISLKELVQDAEIIHADLQELKVSLDNSKKDEERAKKQLLKLQLIMNEMQVKIRKNKLPSISGKYEDDLVKAYNYIHSVEVLLKEKLLDITFLNSTLQEAIDYIYKLYNNVNNIVGMAIMVENTIVFGNKYRSTYPDIDSELTRAELCYRNGEYTQALTIAIGTIEKIFPNTYEELIKDNAKSVA